MYLVVLCLCGLDAVSGSRLEAVWKHEKHKETCLEAVWKPSGSRLEAVWKPSGSMTNTRKPV